MLRGIGSATLGVERDGPERAVFTKQRRNEYAAVFSGNLLRHADKIEFRRGIAHRTSIGNHPSRYTVSNIHPAVGKTFRGFTSSMDRHCLATLIVDNKDNAGIEGNNGAKLVGYEGHSVA